MIEFKKGAPEAIDCKVYPMSCLEDEALKEFLDEQLMKGYIRPSKSQYASSFFFIKKKDEKLRLVQDYRKINDITIRNQYPLPLISDLITDLCGAHIYTKLDIRWGTTTYVSKKVTNIKPPSKHVTAYTNLQSCFSALRIRQQPSKP